MRTRIGRRDDVAIGVGGAGGGGDGIVVVVMMLEWWRRPRYGVWWGG